MTDRQDDLRRDNAASSEEDAPEAGRGRSGSGAPVSEDPTGDAEYRGADDQDAGPIFSDTADGDQVYGRTTR